MAEPRDTVEIVTIPCLTDNYAYLVKAPGPGGVSPATTRASACPAAA